jgi:hypothetical protein
MDLLFISLVGLILGLPALILFMLIPDRQSI